MKRYAPWIVIVVLMVLYSAALFALYANHPVSASDFNLMLTLAHLRIGSETGVSWLILSTPFFGMMILWGWLMMLLRRQPLNPDIHITSSPSA